MAPPRLPLPVEHRILRAACGAPEWLQRMAMGAPMRIEGQELAPEIQMLLRLATLAGGESVAAERTPEQARAENRHSAASVARRPPLPMARVEPLRIPGPAGPIPARLYAAPGAPPAPRPLLVYFHGGGWCIGGLETHDAPCRFLATHGGAAVLSVDYRLAPEHPFPAAVDDALAAFRWAADSAGELGIDPARIAVIGDSAGGNLAAAVSLLTRDGGGPGPAMQVLIYPVTDAVGGQRSRDAFARGFLLTKADMDWFESHYLPDTAAATDPRVSMLRAEDLAGLPPAYVTIAGFDPLRDEGEEYAGRMRAAGVKVALRRHPGLIHGFANLTAISRTARAAMHELAGAVRMGLG
ncbi:MAG TPA: alpha/beta hydrolase [Solirubrobacterales bacterium]|jgi:acetyl esterase|nr:alpha/beta hydrolase [Solirubrobacterales bacterium]